MKPELFRQCASCARALGTFARRFAPVLRRISAELLPLVTSTEGLPLLLGAAIGVLWFIVGGFWSAVGTMVLGIGSCLVCAWYARRVLRKDGLPSEGMFLISMLLFGYTWGGLGFVIGWMGWSWAMPATILLIPAYCVFLDWLAP